MTQPFVTLEIDGNTLALWPKNAYEVQEDSDVGTIGFAFETQRGVDAIGSSRKRAFVRQANTLSWVPRGCAMFSHSKEGGEYLVVHAKTAEQTMHVDAAQRPLNAILDDDAIQAAFLLRRLLVSAHEAAPPRARDAASVDILGAIGVPPGVPPGCAPAPDHDVLKKASILSAVDVLRAAIHHGLQANGPTTTSWLNRTRLDAIDRLVDHHLHETLSVDRLASELTLSVGFLVRAFRQSLGVTPHRYIMERRIAHARRLLQGQDGIADIAAACGFSDQAHLTRFLRTTLGVTPSRYRRMHR